MTIPRAVRDGDGIEDVKLLSEEECELVAAGFIPGSVMDYECIIWENDDGTMSGISIDGNRR